MDSKLGNVHAFCCALTVHNIDNFHRHGAKGRYQALTCNKIREIEDIIEKHENQSSRYPAPEQLSKTGPMDANVFHTQSDSRDYFNAVDEIDLSS